MGVLLQAFFKLSPQDAVPSPADGNLSTPWWWDHLAKQANDLRKAGFSAVWLPPVLKTISGAKPGADGYGPFDDYDIGSKNQKGSVPTRFGTRDQLQRCVAIMRANGLDVYLDMVEHQRVGDIKPFVFRYLGADGTPDIGRFPKNPLNFLPQVARDPNLGGPPADDIPFGRELAPINAKPPHYVFDNLISAADWLTRALDVQGYRIDDVKGLSTDFLFPFLQSRSMVGKFAVGEFFDGNRILVNGWVSNPRGMQNRCSAFDFPMRFVIASMCNNAGRFNMADLDHLGLTGISPAQAVTFVENHDTDSGPSRVVFNKLLAYAYILTSEGYPCVFYRDYSTDKNCYGLKQQIDNLIWIHENLANGPTQQRWMDFDVFAYERLNQPHLLVGLNNNPDSSRTITVATGFGAGVTLHDYTGHRGNAVTDGNGSVTITIPQNQNGLGYVCYSRDGLGGGFKVDSHAVTQVFEGAPDLDILPARGGTAVDAGRIWCNAGTPVQISLQPDMSNWSDHTEIVADILAPNGSRVATKTYKRDTSTGSAFSGNAPATGFHTLRLTAANTPPSNANPAYRLSATYTAPQLFAEPVGAAPGIPAGPQGPSEKPEVAGQWGAVFSLPNVAIHAHVLPNAKVLFWGRRDHPTDSLNVHECTPFVWDPSTKTSTPTPQPTLADGTKINLFCSGHTFLPDGRLLVIGGHLADSNGLNQSCIYDPVANKWQTSGVMNQGRWYPTAVTLSDGTVLASSGSFFVTADGKSVGINNVQQIWQNGLWRSIVTFDGLPLFPRMHVAPDGRVFMSGTNAQTFFLDTRNNGTWTPLANGARANGARDYAPSVMFDEGKVLYVGGGNNPGTLAPTNAAEMIDLNAAAPVWRSAGAMKFPRRQHNATILPDGSVLVTGGTRGGGGLGGGGFNDLTPGEPVHTAELWDPATSQWTQLAGEAVDRCYHATAVLLPDATVLSAGGGEYLPVASGPENDPKDSHRDAQIFSPPYLFRGSRPQITGAPSNVAYGQTFQLQTPEPAKVSLVSWIRLPSVTHSFDQNQRINFLRFTVAAGGLSVTSPPDANVCPPGHYMLFVLNQAKVPSVAKIVQIRSNVPLAAAKPFKLSIAMSEAQVGTLARDAAVIANSKGTRVVVGVTPSCPYGISACWGGAYEALQNMQGVEAVRPIPDAEDSVAYVYLKHDGLPDLNKWPEQFTRTANGTYRFRGVEVTLSGTIEQKGVEYFLVGNDRRPPVALAPLQAADKIQWDHKSASLKPLEDDERLAFEQLVARTTSGPNSHQVTVTGPLKETDTGFTLEVRQFEVLNFPS